MILFETGPVSSLARPLTCTLPFPGRRREFIASVKLSTLRVHRHVYEHSFNPERNYVGIFYIPFLNVDLQAPAPQCAPPRFRGCRAGFQTGEL